MYGNQQQFPPMGAPPGGGMYHGNQQMGGDQSQPQPKHDIFVGNLAFSTTEEQLHQAFSELGRIVKVRMVNDLETGKPRGFAFIEFEDPQAALSAIRNMNDYEINGRRIRVNFSNSSHLETLAGRLGMDLSQHTHNAQPSSAKDAPTSGTTAVADALLTLTKGEMYDVVAQLKAVADRDPDEARKLLCGHPQLPESILYLMSKLDMIKTPVENPNNGVLPAVVPPPPPPQINQPQRTDPRNVPSDPRAQAPSDPRARVDPRQQRADPRAGPPRAMPPPPNMPPPPIPPPGMPGQHHYGVPPPNMAGSSSSSVANLDPGLVQQVMSLTPEQIGRLPPDKQQSILALRQQITGSAR